MLTSVLLPDTLVRQNGAGPAVALESAGRVVLLTLGITRILEYESLELSIAGSADSAQWRRLSEFPPESYCGTYTMRLDLSAAPDVCYLRAEWKVARLTASADPPLFEFSLRASEGDVKTSASRTLSASGANADRSVVRIEPSLASGQK